MKITRCSGKIVQNAIVEYNSHRSAALARRYLIPNRKELWGSDTIVDWAKTDSCHKVSPLPPNILITVNEIRNMVLYYKCDKIAKGWPISVRQFAIWFLKYYYKIIRNYE
jgi:hypothetical protein